MEILTEIMDYVIALLVKAPIFIGIIAFLGLVFQKKPMTNVLSGSLKTLIGMTIMIEGNAIVMKAFQPMSDAFTELFSIEGSIKIGSHVDFIAQTGSMIGIIMLLSLIGNILVARYTRFKTLALNGDNYFWFPLIFLGVGAAAGLEGKVLFWFALAFNLLFTVIWPYLMVKPCENLTGGRSFTIAHTSAIFCLIGDFIGRFIGNKEHSTENIKLPDKLSFLKDTTIVSAIAIWIVYVVLGLMIGPENRLEYFGADPLIIFGLTQGSIFATGLIVLLTGARMVISELVPAFSGIANKLAPNSIPGLDIPLVFPYGPTALVMGFIISMVTSIATLFALGALNLLQVAIVPLTLACYFDVAPGAIFANARGGRVAAIVTSALGGVLLMVFVAITLPMVASTVGDFVQAYGGNGYSVWIFISSIVADIIQSIMG